VYATVEPVVFPYFIRAFLGCKTYLVWFASTCYYSLWALLI
jgi:hypothetical protein